MNVRRAISIYIQEEENTSWNNGAASERLTVHLLPREPGEPSSLGFFFLRELPPWFLPAEAGAKDVQSSTAKRPCALRL